MSRRRKWLLGLGVPLLAFFVLVLLVRRAVRQERLDRAVIVAVRAQNAPTVAALLAQGADPNAHERPQAPPETFWQRFLEMLRGKPRQRDTPYTSALAIATRREFDADEPPKQANAEAVFRALLGAGATRDKMTGQAADSLTWAEQWIRRIANTPLLSQDEWPSDSALRDAIENLQNVMAKNGPSERAYTRIAQCQMHRGKYEDAGHALRMALLLSPSFSPARELVPELELKSKISHEIAYGLPRGSEVVCVMPYSAEGQKFWLALTAAASRPEDMKPMVFYSNVHLALFVAEPKGLRRVWQSPVLASRDVYSGVYTSLSLSIFDIIGDKQPEIILEPLQPSNSMSANVFLFGWRQHRLKPIFQKTNMDALWLQDLSHNGHYVVRDFNWVGSEVRHEYNWSNIYALQNGRYVLANRWFPAQFKKELRFLPPVIKQHPHDAVLWCHLAYTYELCAEPEKAASAWKRAEREYRQSLASETDAEWRKRLRRSLNEIRAHKFVP